MIVLICFITFSFKVSFKKMGKFMGKTYPNNSPWESMVLMYFNSLENWKLIVVKKGSYKSFRQDRYNYEYSVKTFFRLNCYLFPVSKASCHFYIRKTRIINTKYIFILAFCPSGCYIIHLCMNRISFMSFIYVAFTIFYIKFVHRLESDAILCLLYL